MQPASFHLVRTFEGLKSKVILIFHNDIIIYYIILYDENTRSDINVTSKISIKTTDRNEADVCSI